MIRSETALGRELDDHLLDGKYREGTDVVCRLLAAQPDEAARLATHMMSTAAPHHERFAG